MQTEGMERQRGLIAALVNDGRPLLDKVLHVFGERPHVGAARAPFITVPLVYEHAYGGPGEPIRVLATVRPYDDPGPSPFYYRFRKIHSTIVPWMTARGANVQLNSIMMNDNMEDLVPLALLARKWGATIMYTLYSELPADNHGHLFPPDRLARLRQVLAELSRIKKEDGTVANAHWYFDRIPSYLQGEVIHGCTAGKKTLHISPGGMVRACAELPMVSHFSAYDNRTQPEQTCTKCFQACRGEVQAPITPRRIAEAVRMAVR